MPGSNDFLTFAGGVGANVVTQGAYAALTTTLANGFTSGTAESAKLNKVWRQSAIMSAVLAQFIVDETGANAVDDGTTATLLSNLKDAALSLVERTTSTVGGTVDAITATYTRPPTAFKVGVSYFLRSAGANTSATPTFTPNSGVLATKAIVKFGNTALVAGDIGIAGHWLELVYDATLDKWQLQNAATAATATNLAGGSGGTIPYQSSAGVTAMLANGTAGQVLQSNGTTLAPSYVTPAAGVSPSATTPLVDTSAGAVGTGTTYARNDHSHPALASSLAANGYQKFPSGLILQWGTTAALGQSTSITVTLPIAFTTTVYSVTATMNGSFDIGTTEAGVSASASGLTQIIIGKGTNAAGAGTSRPVAWMAVGV